MKFHYLGQHLLDTNCLLLILKIFGLQEVASSVISKADAPDHKFVDDNLPMFKSRSYIHCPQFLPILPAQFFENPTSSPSRRKSTTALALYAGQGHDAS